MSDDLEALKAQIAAERKRLNKQWDALPKYFLLSWLAFCVAFFISVIMHFLR